MMTRGNVIIENIKVGDIHYEYDLGLGIICKVLTLPKENEEGQWEWKSENLKSGVIIDYLFDPEYPHYSPNLYDNPAYEVNTYI